MKLGVCYYPEHWPPERWPIDARLMREAGLSIVRIGEFAWAQIQPAEDQFKWGWLDAAIAILAEEGLQVVLGTPTAAPPAWLCHQYPEVLPVDNQGRQRRFGSRRHYCPNSPTYRDLTRRIVSALAERYAAHQAVTGWQIDNEFGDHDTARCYCVRCAAEFRRWLQNKYASLEALNRAWGAAFWSQTYSDWEQVYPPNLTVTQANPSHELDYFRFASDSFVAYQQIQIDILRGAIEESMKPDRKPSFITTNFMGNFTDLDNHALARPLDLVSWDSYPTGKAEMQSDNLYLPGDDRPYFAYDAGDPYVTGFCHDLTRGLKRGPFWVMEQQCGNINWSRTNAGIRPGSVRLWTWHALASGAETVMYFRWRAVRYAQEQMHSGLLRHDASPAQGYIEVKAMAAELPLMEQVAAEPMDARAALLLDYSDLWAVQLQLHHRDFGYLRHLFVFYRALAALGMQVDIISPQEGLENYQIAIAPTAILGSQALADQLGEFTRRGGSLLVGVRSGFKTPDNLAAVETLPGFFRSLVGASVTDWHSLPPGIKSAVHSDIPGLSGPVSLWAEALKLDGEETSNLPPATCLAHYTSDPFEAAPALAERRIGSGRALYLGWYPSFDQAKALVRYLAGMHGIPLRDPLPPGVILIRRGRYWLLLNFTEHAVTTSVAGKIAAVGSRDISVIEE